MLIICIKDDGTIFHHSLKGDKFAFYISRPRKAVRRLLFFSRTQVIVSTTKTKSLFNLFWLQRNQVLLLSSQLHDFLKKTSNELVSSEPAVNQWWTRSETEQHSLAQRNIKHFQQTYFSSVSFFEPRFRYIVANPFQFALVDDFRSELQHRLLPSNESCRFPVCFLLVLRFNTINFLNSLGE